MNLHSSSWTEFVYSWLYCIFINIYCLLSKRKQFYPFIWFCWHASLQRSQREPGTFWMCCHEYEVDVSIQEIRARRPALLSPRDAPKRHSCRRRSLITPRIKVKEQDEDEFWKTTSRPPGCPDDPRPSISPHSDTVTNILDGRPWRSRKQGKKGGGGSVIHAPLLSKDD